MSGDSSHEQGTYPGTEELGPQARAHKLRVPLMSALVDLSLALEINTEDPFSRAVQGMIC